uniref:Uncharacterized protein n=1 Tax=Pipistrellus kuhlii TaxID=59472 RepID=A0A7J7WLF5_PIPKU|nr:hypothetical protein mPipKuh1_007935 [Pipistrellus kuhlii]
MQIVPLTRSSTSKQAGQPPMFPPPGLAGRTPPVHKFMSGPILYIHTYTEWPDYYAFRDHNNLATQCTPDFVELKPHIENRFETKCNGDSNPQDGLQCYSGLSSALPPVVTCLALSKDLENEDFSDFTPVWTSRIEGNSSPFSSLVRLGRDLTGAAGRSGAQPALAPFRRCSGVCCCLCVMLQEVRNTSFPHYYVVPTVKEEEINCTSSSAHSQ